MIRPRKEAGSWKPVGVASVGGFRYSSYYKPNREKEGKMIIATVTATDGKISAIPATHWSPMKKKIMEAGAAKAGMTLTYTTR